MIYQSSKSRKGILYNLYYNDLEQLEIGGSGISFTLLATSNTNNQVIEVDDLSQFSYVIILCRGTTDNAPSTTICSTTVPISEFKNGWWHYANYNGIVEVGFTYLSNTSVKCTITKSGYFCQLYGVKATTGGSSSIYSNSFGFIDTSNLITQITEDNCTDRSYTATEDCWAIGYVRATSVGTGYITLTENENSITLYTTTDATITERHIFPVKKGQTFKIPRGVFDFIFYGMNIEPSTASHYNPDTDAYDIYYNGEIVGSIPCGFQTLVLYKAGVTPTGVTINNNGTGVTINSNNIQLKGGYSYGGAADGNALFTKLIKLDSKSKIFVECNISTVGYDGRFYIGLATSDTASISALVHSKYFSNYSTGLTTGTKTLEMDVSSITGNFYVCVGILSSVYNNDALVATVSKVTVE